MRFLHFTFLHFTSKNNLQLDTCCLSVNLRIIWNYRFNLSLFKDNQCHCLCYLARFQFLRFTWLFPQLGRSSKCNLLRIVRAGIHSRFIFIRQSVKFFTQQMLFQAWHQPAVVESIFKILSSLAFVLICTRVCFVCWYTGWSKKTAQNLWHHNFATVRHRVMWFSAKCSERNSLHD